MYYVFIYFLTSIGINSIKYLPFIILCTYIFFYINNEKKFYFIYILRTHVYYNICYVHLLIILLKLFVFQCQNIGPPIVVATFDKQSHVKYAATETNTTLLHVVIRFYPFDVMSGTILRRFDDNCDDCDSIQLSLIDSHIFLTVILDGCNHTLPSPLTINVRKIHTIHSINYLIEISNYI